MNPIAWFNPGRWLLYAALAGALWAGYLTWREHQRELGREEIRNEYTIQALQESEIRRAEELRRNKEHQEIINEAQKQAESARADAAAARGAAGRLQAELAAYRGRACPNSAPGDGGEAAAATERMLADVQRRLDEATDRIAGFADQSRIAGLACERKYDALTR
jgi:hypothetical protein